MEFTLWDVVETLTIKDKVGEIPFSAKEVLIAIMPPINKGGYTLDELVTRKNLIPRLESAKESVFLSLDESEFLLSRINATRFPVASDNLLKLRENLQEHAKSCSNTTANR